MEYADDFHLPANIAKMSGGTPLDDADHEPWLDAIGRWAAGWADQGAVVSCSALKRVYRDRLRAHAPEIVLLHLTGDRELITERQLDSVGDLGVSRCGSMIGRHARVVLMTDPAVEVHVVPASPFR